MSFRTKQRRFDETRETTLHPIKFQNREGFMHQKDKVNDNGLNLSLGQK
jgi:hypothetical protein